MSLIPYRPLYGDERLLAPLTKEERARNPMHGCREWVKEMKARGRAKSKLAKQHSAFMRSVGKHAAPSRD